MKRVFLFLVTNLAVLVVASVVLRLLGVEGYLTQRGVGVDMRSLLIFCAVFGMVGSLISLLLSKPMAMRMVGGAGDQGAARRRRSSGCSRRCGARRRPRASACPTSPSTTTRRPTPSPPARARIRRSSRSPRACSRA